MLERILELLAIFSLGRRRLPTFSAYICHEKVNSLRKRHKVAIDILTKLNLDNIRIEQTPNGHYFVWLAWTLPIPVRNGHAATKHGKLKIPA